MNSVKIINKRISIFLFVLLMNFIFGICFSLTAGAQEEEIVPGLDIKKAHFYDNLSEFFEKYGEKTAPDALTIENCIKISLENNLELGIAVSKTREDKFKIDQARSAGNPTLAANWTYSYTDPIPSFNLPSFGGVSLPAMSMFNQANYDLKMTAKYLISNFGNLHNTVKIACLVYMRSLAEQERITNNSNLEVVNAFFTLVETKGFMAVAKAAISARELQYRIARDNFDVGIFPKFELLQANVGLKQAELEVIKAVRGMELVKAKMRNILGINQTVDIDVVQPRFLAFELPDLEKAIETGYKNRPEMIQINLAVDIAKTSVDLAYGGKNPVIVLIGNYDYQTQSVMNLASSWNAAINLQFPIFDGGNTKALVGQAKESLKQANLAKDQLKRNIALQIKSSHLSVIEAAKKMETEEANLDQAKEAYDISMMRYAEGISTNIELENTLVSYLQSNSNLLSAYCEYQRAWATLLNSMGVSLKGVYHYEDADPKTSK